MPLNHVCVAYKAGDPRVVWLLIQAMWGAELFDQPGAHYRDLVTEHEGFFLIVSDEDRGYSELDEQTVNLCTDSNT